MPRKSLRAALLAVAGSEALYLLCAFCSASLLDMGPLFWYREAVDLFRSLIVVPWGGALCLLSLERRERGLALAPRADAALLLALLVWIVAPFLLRFGLTFNTAYSAYNHLALFFGLYLPVAAMRSRDLSRTVDAACTLFAALSYALAVPALCSVFAGRAFGLETGGIGFGPDAEGCLCFGLHYNITGMIAVCCALLCIAGALRRRTAAGVAFFSIPAALMAICAALTQSRTSRYALLLSLAALCYGCASARLPLRRAAARHVAAAALAAAVLACGYAGSGAVTQAALVHYARVRTGASAAPVASALAEEAAQIAPEASETPAAPAVVSRAVGDATFSERTAVWKNLFALWREEPLHFFIGNGMGRTGSRVVQGTIHEANGSVSIHNGYLQFIADYGLIGFALLAALLCLLARDALFLLLSPAARACDRAFVALSASQLLTALMESQPLGAMSSSSLALFFALAVVRARARDVRAAM